MPLRKPENRKFIGQRIRELIKSRGQSQTGIAAMTGLSDATVSAVIKGDAGQDSITLVCSALFTSPDEILQAATILGDLILGMPFPDGSDVSDVDLPVKVELGSALVRATAKCPEFGVLPGDYILLQMADFAAPGQAVLTDRTAVRCEAYYGQDGIFAILIGGFRTFSPQIG